MAMVAVGAGRRENGWFGGGLGMMGSKKLSAGKTLDCSFKWTRKGWKMSVSKL